MILPFCKTIGTFAAKLNLVWGCDPVIAIFSIYPHELQMYVAKTPDHDVCYNLIDDCQILVMVKMPFKMTTDKKNFESPPQKRNASKKSYSQTMKRL